MEDLAPPLRNIVEIRFGMEAGKSLRESLLRALHRQSDEFSKDLREWLVLVDQGRDFSAVRLRQKSFHRQVLIDVYWEGLQGHSILPTLRELEKEIWQASEAELEAKATDLAMKAMIPVFLFLFPAFLLLIFGPLMSRLILQLEG